MAADRSDGRMAIGPASSGLIHGELLRQARRAAAWLARRTAKNVAVVDVNSIALPITLFGAATAGLPFAPLNYRWDDAQLRRAAERLSPVVCVVDDPVVARLAGIDGVEVIARQSFLAQLEWETAGQDPAGDVDREAILLFTSGTSGDPKVAVLGHDKLSSYVLRTVDFMGAARWRRH